MSSLVLTGDTSGQVTISAPAVAGTNTLTLQAATATNAVNTLGTAVASTSGTAIDFTDLPSWIKRITVMFSGVSTSGTSPIQIQLGDSGGVETTGYSSGSVQPSSTSVVTSSSTTGLLCTHTAVATETYSGSCIISQQSTNVWLESGNILRVTGAILQLSAGSKTLSDTLTQVRITTVNGTDTFDAGSVNIMYEG